MFANLIPGFIAKKLCPELIFVKIHHARYYEMSNQVMDVFRRYDSNMCAAGADEGYLKSVSAGTHIALLN
jgi:DNA polymerase kappa